jgi:signal transduction histidine kinase
MDEGSTDAHPGPSPSVSVDAIPAPVIGYGVLGGEPVIAETNEQFESAFGVESDGTPVRRWLQDAVGIAETRAEDVCSSLADGEAIDAELGGTATAGETSERVRYQFRTFGDADDRETIEGYVLLIEPPDGTGNVETDRIASVISHDLRNPLDVANAHLRAARETGGSEHFDQIRQSHDRMEQIIKDVLTLARGKSALSIATDVDIESVAADAWATVDTRGASLALEDDLPTTAADPDRLQRLFENLFRNSIEHAHPGNSGGSSSVDGGHDGDADHPLQVRVGRTDGGFFVADNGTGVALEDRTRVFDPGYSSDETGSGTGLGLTIVEEIAEAHGWTVSLTSGSTGGARFEFRPPGGDDHRENGAES